MNEKLTSTIIAIVCLLGILILVGVSIIVNEGSVNYDCNCENRKV